MCRLFLILKKDREEHAWQFPQLVHVDPDPAEYPQGTFMPGLRETAEGAMKQFAGAGMQGYFYSHAPQGFYYYPYTEDKGTSFGVRSHIGISLRALRLIKKSHKNVSVIVRRPRYFTTE